MVDVHYEMTVANFKDITLQRITKEKMINKNQKIQKNDINENIITVFDIGCRFGIHPSWSKLKKKEFLKYYAFDVDEIEIKRLILKYKEYSNYIAIHRGFSNSEEIAELNILAHHGQSSFFRPNLSSDWYRNHRALDAVIESKKLYELTTLDIYCNREKIYPDFLKIDTEGYDYRILEGGKNILKSVIAIRCEVQYQEVFKLAESFADLNLLLSQNGFQLANLDYDGKGIPKSYFCPNLNKYGIMIGGEAVFIRNYDYLKSLSVNKKISAILFCFLNNLEDSAYQLLIEMNVNEKKIVKQDPIWNEIKRQYCLCARNFLYIPGDNYARATKDYSIIFDSIFPERHEFYESDFLNPA